jgi:hypothetical protein
LLPALCLAEQPAHVLTGDGVKDDAPALQALINAGTGTVVLKRGTYRLGATVVIDLDRVGFTSLDGGGTAQLLMAGAGPALRFVGNHGGTADPSSVKPTVWEKQRMPSVEGVEIVGAHAEADGVEAVGTMQFTLSRCLIRLCRHGVRLTDRNRNFIISHCHIYENRGIGVFLDNVNLHQGNITGSHISYCRGGGVVSHGGNVRNLHIGTCDIESNMAADAPPTANVWLDSTGGSIGEVAITGCTIQHSSKAPGCANIRVTGAGEDPALERRAGRKHTREGNITIGNNVFSDVQVNIHLQDARGVTITGNTFWEGFERDLLVERCSHIVVSANNFDRNPRYLVNGFDNAERNGILFSASDDCAVNGNLISGVWKQQAAVHLKECQRFNVGDNSILDSDGIGLLLDQCSRCLVSGNVIRDDRDAPQRIIRPSLRIVGNNENVIGSNLLGNGKKLE